MTLCLFLWQRVSCQRGGDRDIDVFLSLRHVTLLSIRFPALILGIWITRGSVSYPCWEKKGDLVYLKEHAGLRGLFPQRGGYESECHSDSTHSHTASASACCQGAPALTSSTSPSFPLFHHVILGFLLILTLSSSSVSQASSYWLSLPSRHATFLLPLLVQCCPTGNGEWRSSEDGCYSNHTSDAARVQ